MSNLHTMVASAPTGAEPVTRAVAAPADRSRWAEIADADALSLPSQTPRWMDVLERSGRFRDASRWYRFDDGVEAVLILAKRRGIGGISGLASLPNGWGIGGAVSTAPLTGSHTREIFRDLLTLRQIRVSVWPAAMQGAAWQDGRPEGVASQYRRAHVLDVSSGFDYVMSKRFTHVTRRYYRRSINRGVTVEECSDGRLIPELRQLIMRAVPYWAAQQNELLWLAKARATLREPLAKFRSITEVMGPLCRVAIARVDGEAIGGILYLLGRNVESIWMPIDPDRGRTLQAATALQVHMVRSACEHGCRYADFGESGRSHGLDASKRRFGAMAIDYESYRIERLPLSPLEDGAKHFIKRMIGFRDVEEELPTPESLPDRHAQPAA